MPSLLIFIPPSSGARPDRWHVTATRAVHPARAVGASASLRTAIAAGPAVAGPALRHGPHGTLALVELEVPA